MDEGRIGLCRRGVDQHRKTVCVLNDIVKNRSSVYNNYLSREQHESNYRYFKTSRDVRRNIVRQKVLLKCMDMRKRTVQTRLLNDRRSYGHQGLYGRYDGIPLHALSRDVDIYIAAMHPRLRRIQRVQRLLEEGVEKGALLDKTTLSRKMSSLFHHVNRPLRPTRRDNLDSSEGSELGDDDVTKSRNGKTSVGKLHRNDFSRRGSRLSSRGDNLSPPREEKSLRVVGNELGTSESGRSGDTSVREGGATVRGVEKGDNSHRGAERRESRDGDKERSEKKAQRRRSKPETGLTFDTANLSRRPTLVLPPIASTRELLRPVRRE